MSEVCESVATSSSVEAIEIEAMETPPRGETPERSLEVTFRLDNAETDVDCEADAEFEFDENQNNAMVLELLAAVATSQRCL